MSEQIAEHCGHDCCDTPNMPFHDHFLDGDECPACRSVREKERELWERVTGLSDEVAQAKPDSPEQIEDVGPDAWRVLNAAAAFGHPGGSWQLLSDLVTALRSGGWSLVRLDDEIPGEAWRVLSAAAAFGCPDGSNAIVAALSEAGVRLVPVGSGDTGGET